MSSVVGGFVTAVANIANEAELVKELLFQIVSDPSVSWVPGNTPHPG